MLASAITHTCIYLIKHKLRAADHDDDFEADHCDDDDDDVDHHYDYDCDYDDDDDDDDKRAGWQVELRPTSVAAERGQNDTDRSI